MRAMRRRPRADGLPPVRIEMDAELLDLKAQAEGRAAFRQSEYYEGIHERVSEKSKEMWKLMPTVRLKFNFYMTARRLHESLREVVPT
jgi:hypothetical protein